jgi:hypothetical protein
MSWFLSATAASTTGWISGPPNAPFLYSVGSSVITPMKATFLSCRHGRVLLRPPLPPSQDKGCVR